MLDIKSDLYDKAFQQWNMTPVASERSYAQAGCSYRMDNEEGSGEYWVYSRDNFFAVSAFRIEFKSQGIMRFRHTEHLSVSYYDKAGLIAKARTATPRPGTVSTYIASEGNEYVARFSPGSTVQATSITVSPDYYRTYLHERFGNIPDMRKAFLLVDGRPDCPELIALFKQIKRYRGAGMAADLFYEGAVAEALALIIKRASEIEEEDAGRESALPPLDDRKSLDNVGSFIRNNLDANLTCNVLAHRACMGHKATFKVTSSCPQRFLRYRSAHGRSWQQPPACPWPIRRKVTESRRRSPEAFRRQPCAVRKRMCASAVRGPLPSCLLQFDRLARRFDKEHRASIRAVNFLIEATDRRA